MANENKEQAVETFEIYLGDYFTHDQTGARLICSSKRKYIDDDGAIKLEIILTPERP